MPLYKIEDKALKPVHEKAIDLERDLQRLTEKSLEEVFGLKFIATEFPLRNFRIDTLAFDPESNSFVILEYKRDKSFSVVDQGLTYLALMLDNKADFILEYNDKAAKPLDRNKVDWSQSRVMFLNSSFTIFQQGAINFRNFPIELWEVKMYEGGLISYTQRIADETKESIQTVLKNKAFQSVAKEVKSFNMEDHIEHKSEAIQDLFKQLREMLLGLGSDVKEVPKKLYIAYKTDTNFTDVVIHSNFLTVYLNLKSGTLNDPRGLARDLAKPKPVDHWGNGDYEVIIKPGDDLLYPFELIRQAYGRGRM